LGGIFWKLLGKKILFWRNHPYGNIITRIAVALSDTVFCTADKSYTAQFKKTVRMPAGVDTTLFKDGVVERSKNRLLVFGRIAPVKNIEKVIDAVTLLNAKGLSYSLSIVGDVLPRDAQYIDFLKARVHESRMDEYIKFLPGVVFSDGPIVYGMHEVCINVTASGSFDKTVIEALACGTKVLVSNTSMKHYVPEGSFIETGDVEHIAQAIERITSMNEQELTAYKDRAGTLVNQESLDTLIHTLISYV
jgi:glycosyltransferase involved in cell wall biosynthesis